MENKHICILQYLAEHMPSPYFAGQWQLPEDEIVEIISNCGLSSKDELANHFRLMEQLGYVEFRGRFSGRLTALGYAHAESAQLD